MQQPGLPGSQFRGEDEISRSFRDIRQAMQQFSAANVLASAGINAAAGGILVNGFMEFKRSDGTLGVKVDPATGTFVAYNAAGTSPVARFGALLETAPGSYGVEVLVGSTWVQVGAQTTTWSTISGKPGDPGGATIPGTSITGTVPDATTATTSTQTDGATSAAFNRDIAGIPGTYKTVWMHSNGQIGYNTSSLRYKKNVRDFKLTTEQAMSLRAVLYDRKATGADDFTPAVSVDELGLIAEEVAAVVPQLALSFDGEIDSVFYERLGVALLPVVQEQQRTIDALLVAVRELGGNV